MPWPRKQAVAVMLHAQRKGDAALAQKARRSLKKDTPVVRAQRRKR